MTDTAPWSLVVQSLRRPYRVTASMVMLVSLVPLYIFIPLLTPRRTLHVPEVAFDRLVPLQPAWALIYGALYLVLIVLPVFLVREEAHIRRTVRAYLAIWITAYICFIVYPTVAPRPIDVTVDGFAAWGLQILYSSDPPYNCFPSLHVAHSFVSALTCARVHRGVGIAATIAASFVGLSTLFTKQHYVLDVVAGVLLAFLAVALFLRKHRPEDVPELDRRLAPLFALGLTAAALLVLGGYWVAYRLTSAI